MSAGRSVAVVGGGILGLTAAYRLLQQGVDVELYERAPDLGGLVGSFDLDGRPADRFYHVVLPTDDRVRGLAEELGLGDRFRFRPTQVGFYDDGRLFSMSTLREFATFPLLGPVDRARLASFVVRCNLARDSSRLDETPLLEWLERMCGRRVTDRLWRPLLDSKFDGRYDDLPATYLWARTRRMSATRDSGGREVMGWLEGGYQTLVDALVARIESLGGRVHASTAVDRIVRGGVVVGGSLRPASLVLCTLAPPQARMVLDPSLRDECPPDHCRYLGVVCLVVRATRSVSPYYTLNITDRRIPLTTVVETTHVVDPDAAGGHLVYVTKYVDPSHDDLGAPVEDVRARYLEQMRRIFPLRDDEVDAAVIQRARVVEPVHTLGGARRIPDMFAVPGLVLASTAHVYPEIVNGQAVIGVADRAVAGILERIEAPLEAAA